MNIGFLFDLDGVLIDSETAYTQIWEEIDLHFHTGVENFAYRIKGTTLENILNTYFPLEIHEDVKQMLAEKENSLIYNYCVGAEELLECLSVKGISKAIVTSSLKDKMENLRLQKPELWEMVSTVVDGDSVVKSKPDPQGYLIAAERLSLSPSQCVVVEDSLQGIRAGKAAGCYVVGLSTTLGREALEGEPDVLLDSLEQLDLDEIFRILNHGQ